MFKIQNSKLIIVLILIPILFQSIITIAQPQKIKSVSLSEDIVYSTIDRTGDLYLFTHSGQIQKFSSDGNLLNLFKDNTLPPITLFDPRDGARMLMYFRDQQYFSFLNPSFEVTQSFALDSSLTSEPWLVCTSGEHGLWIFDATEMTLKKVNTKEETIVVNETINEVHEKKKIDFTLLREYQNFVFLLDHHKGILIFNSLGKFIRLIEAKHLNYFNFIGEELYYMEHGKLNFFDLFTTETREMELPQLGEFAFITDAKLYVIHKKALEIFDLTPTPEKR